MSYFNLILQPTDILFFRDGRPIEGSLSGFGAAWPLPSVVNAALHAALHRAYPVSDLSDGAREATTSLGDHIHKTVKNGVSSNRARRFGSVQTAGPFPVEETHNGFKWFFPRPLDISLPQLHPSLSPDTSKGDFTSMSSLPKPLIYPVASWAPPSKEIKAPTWIDKESFEAYLSSEGAQKELVGINDHNIFDTEKNIGIAIDPDSGVVESGKFYSAQYLRLKEHWRLGELATARQPGELKLFQSLFDADSTGKTSIIVGGQQRVCTASLNRLESIPLPRGMNSNFSEFQKEDGEKCYLLKWALLSPAIWPKIEAPENQLSSHSRRRVSDVNVENHAGGWLPNWIHPESGKVLLRKVSKEIRQQRRKLNYKNQGYSSDHGGAPEINARLVSAIVPKPISVTGWSLGLVAAEDEEKSGAKSNHLAVPAGSVYYFTADSKDDAKALASVLNWHGGKDDNPEVIKNRRSSLMGEKGYGIGVCGTWSGSTVFNDK